MGRLARKDLETYLDRVVQSTESDKKKSTKRVLSLRNIGKGKFSESRINTETMSGCDHIFLNPYSIPQ